MHKFKAIGFDWGGVISGNHGSKFNKEISKILGVSVEQYRIAHFSHNELVNIHSYTYQQFWPIILKYLGKEDKFDEIMNYCKTLPKNSINIPIVNLIKSLKQKGYKLGLLSNHTLEGATKIRSSEVAKYFDTILISAEIGYMKPQKQAFNLLIKNLNIKSEELIFIDDTERIFSTAKEIGYYPLLYSNFKKLTEDFNRLNIL